MQSEIARQKNAAAPADPARIKALEAELEKSKTEFVRQKQEISRLETDVTSYKEKVSKLELKPEATKQAPRLLVAMAPPSIQIMDPPIVLTRDTATVKVRSGVGTRPVVGRVTAAAGLVSFTANDVPQDIDSEGIFKTNVDLGAGKTRVTMVAVDRQGKRAVIEFFLVPDVAVTTPVAVATQVARESLELANIALIIGNQVQKSAALEHARGGRNRYRGATQGSLQVQRQVASQCNARGDSGRTEQVKSGTDG
jgi:hypothetical protein